MPHKPPQKRVYFEGATYFVTCHTKNWVEFFKEPVFCEVFIANLKLCKQMKNFNLYSFIVILHHFHMMFVPFNATDLSKIMQFFKRNITRDINFIVGASTEEAIHESLLRSEGFSALAAIEKCYWGKKNQILNTISRIRI